MLSYTSLNSPALVNSAGRMICYSIYWTDTNIAAPHEHFSRITPQCKFNTWNTSTVRTHNQLPVCLESETSTVEDLNAQKMR
jgi:hypothetical protein